MSDKANERARGEIANHLTMLSCSVDGDANSASNVDEVDAVVVMLC